MILLKFAFFVLLSMMLAPLLQGIINRVKAFAAGRHGKPLLQTYYDIWRLLHKGEVISKPATWVFTLAPAISLCTTIMAIALLPLYGMPSPFGFGGDFLLAAYLLAMGRFATMLSALDTGSAFEGMGASREAAFSAFSEPAFFLCLLILSSLCLDMGSISVKESGMALSFNAMLKGQTALAFSLGKPALLLPPVIFFILLLAENCRIPVDDPNTHLELTMIHEVMILDQSGPGLAFMIYGASLKLWFFAVLIALLVVPPLGGWIEPVLSIFAIFAAGIAVGITESVMARLRLVKVPQLLGMASVLAALSLILAQAQ